MKALRLIGNLLWIIVGIFTAIGWFVGGLFLSVTIVGIPFGLQAFKIARMNLLPFGFDVVPTAGTFGCVGLAMNLLWIIFVGWWLAISHLICAAILAVLIVTIPFALQHVKLAKVALMPFGMQVVPIGCTAK